jgi:ribonuclease P protein subunit POP4
MTSKDQFVTQTLLARAHSPDSASRIFAEKIQHRPLLLKASSPPPSNARDARRRAREKQATQRAKALKPKPLSARQRRRLGLYEVPKAGQKYAIFEPLHQLWLGYIREVLGNGIYTGGQDVAAKLSSADFHGAEVDVVRSACVSRVGIKGIVIKDGKFVFEIITRKNQVKVVPKEGTIFRLEVPVGDRRGREPAPDGQASGEPVPAGSQIVFELHGDQFMQRSADRANKKFKSHFLKNL